MGQGGCQVEEQGWFRHPATAMRGGGWRRSSDARVGEDGEGGVRLGGAHLEEREGHVGRRRKRRSGLVLKE
jgi:hypothetical protein